ncbi:MAG: hypothetical protein HIU81_06490 [Acidobacteria bacterium]|nr:hypothetical protein [Acidobacteriota bacterium]
MKISVIGCGYLGAVHAATLASMGHQLVGIDTDAGKVDRSSGGAIFEPGLEELLHSGRANGTLGFSTDFADTASADVHFLCVGTPQAKTSELADLSYVLAARLGFGGGCLPRIFAASSLRPQILASPP